MLEQKGKNFLNIVIGLTFNLQLVWSSIYLPLEEVSSDTSLKRVHHYAPNNAVLVKLLLSILKLVKEGRKIQLMQVFLC